ncbi:MAG: hypothetical protein HYX53_04145 [Chloroflexi bacterium]|nr:hypothetical protein [Chloroflexota bacterium]
MHIRFLFALALLSGFAVSLIPALGTATATLAAEPCTTGELVVAQEYDQASDLPPVTEPTVTVSPISGPTGTVATLHVTRFTADLPIEAIFRVLGDPVVGTATTDANGEATFKITIPAGPDGIYWILVRGVAKNCVHASVRFQIAPLTPTPVPTSTPIATPTPTRTPTPVTPGVPTATPTPVTPTPAAPSAGNGPGAAGTTSFGIDFSAIALGIGLLGLGFGMLGSVQRRSMVTARIRSAYAEASWWPGVPRRRTHEADPDGEAVGTRDLDERMRGQR